MRALALLIVTTFVALYTPRAARANGRFPKAEAIATVPGGAGRAIYLVSTFGLVVSEDGGASWRWMCEKAMGFEGTWDPPIAVTRDGRVWIGLPDGLRVTRDGCDVRAVPELAGELVADLTLEPGADRVAVVTSTPGKPALVWRANAKGAGALAPLGKGVEGVSVDTLDVAPSNPARVYATAAPIGGGRRAHLFRSDDGGATLVELEVKLERDGRLFLSAIDPKDPDRIFVRHSTDAGTDLLLSADGGRSFTRVLHTNASMFGFAASPDGATYFAGSGDPAEGLFRSRDRGATWEAASKTSVLCLHADGPRLLACSNPYQKGGWAAAVSIDRGATFRPLGTFDDIAGAIACDAGAGAVCASAWPDVRAQITTPSKRALSADVAPAPDDGGAIHEDASAAAAPSAREGRPRGACGCGARGASEPWAGSLAILAIVALVARRRLDPR